MNEGKSGTRTSVVLGFTDLVGYSAIAQRDERLALALLDTHRSIVRDVLAMHRGLEVKTIGDAFLLEFPSVLDGIACVVDIQRRHAQHNSVPGGEPIRVRAALHIGDVERREGDLLGDSVNVVSRLDALAPPGGIAVSGQIHSLVRNRPEFSARFRSIGKPQLKNMDASIEVFVLDPEGEEPRPGGRLRSGRVRMALGVCAVLALAAMFQYWSDAPAPAVATVISPETSAAKSRQVSGRSVAVLPFVNMSPDPGQEYFSDGLAEELLNALANVGGLKVTARTSSFAFKGKNVPVHEIANTLGVANLLEGSVRRAGDRLRVTAQLIRAEDGFQYWSRSYDRTLDDVFAIQEEIARSVVDELKVTLLEGPGSSLGDRGTQDIKAYDAYLKGLKEFNAENGPAMDRAVAFFEEAVRIDPGFLQPWWWLWRAHGMRSVYGLIPMDDVDRLRAAALAGAEATGKQSADLEYMRGVAEWRKVGRRDNAESRARYEAAVRLDPSHYFARRELIYLDYTGQEMLERRMQLHEEEVARDPLSVAMNRALASNCLELGRLARADELAARLKVLAPGSYWGPMMATDVAMARGDFLTAYKELTDARRRDSVGILPFEAAAMLFAELGDFATARTLASRSPAPGVENAALTGVAVLEGNPAEIRTLRDAAEKSQTDPEMVASLDLLLQIRAGDHESALRSAQKLFEEQPQPSISDVSVYLLVAWLQQKMGDEQASARLLGKVATFLATPGFESAVLDFLRVDWLAISGRGAEAIALLDGLVEKGYRPYSSQQGTAMFTLDSNPFLDSMRGESSFVRIHAELDKRAAVIRDQISRWNLEHPEDARVWESVPAQQSTNGK